MNARFAVAFSLCLLTPVLILDAAETNPVPAFSTSKPGGSLPTGWHLRLLPNKKAPEFVLVADKGDTVLRAESRAAAGTIAFESPINARATPLLTWRWKVDRVIERADLEVKSGDDFAARVYVFFDVPLSTLPFRARASVRLARLVYGNDIPSAAICYVWDNKHPVGTSAWSAYTDRVRNIVLQSGNGRAGSWQTESRDVLLDFKTAFGFDAPGINGIAIGNDTDQTGETAIAWFGDFAFKARP